jgi:uncharacterized protein YkwD
MRFLIILFLFAGCSNSNEKKYKPQETILIGDGLTMLNKINQTRSEFGLNMVFPEKKLNDIAQRYSVEMDGTKILNHGGFHDRQVESGCYSFGECLSYNYTVTSSFEAYVLSKSHSQTLINPRYTHIGYGRSGRYECVLLGGYDIYKQGNIIDTLTVRFK